MSQITTLKEKLRAFELEKASLSENRGIGILAEEQLVQSQR